MESERHRLELTQTAQITFSLRYFIACAAQSKAKIDNSSTGGTVKLLRFLSAFLDERDERSTAFEGLQVLDWMRKLGLLIMK